MLHFSIIRPLAVMGLVGYAYGSRAQTTSAAPLLVHPIRSISAADTSFTNLESLRQEVGAARVMMLGEPTQGEGNVFKVINPARALFATADGLHHPGFRKRVL